MTLTYQHLATGADGDTEIAGTGLRVYTVLALYEMGDSAEYIADEYEVPVGAVYEALAYAADHPEEMAAITRADDAAYQAWMSSLSEHLRQIADEGLAAAEQDRQEAIRQAKEARRGAPIP